LRQVFEVLDESFALSASNLTEKLLDRELLDSEALAQLGGMLARFI
jgi:hypothetical protein